MSEAGKRETPLCPKCGSSEVVPIAYGMPGPELAEASKRGEVELGGCVVTDRDPEWHCKACGHEWGKGVTRPPYHKHIGDPGVGDSTHCICHNLKNPPPGGCGRLHCVNREEQQGDSMTKKSRILMSTTGPDDWQQFLAQPEKHWRAGYSAWALAHCWEAAAGLPAEIEKLLISSTTPDLHQVEPLIALPEYAVDLPGGDRPSMNDVFVLGRTPAGAVTIMVEGKVNESFGPLVTDWEPDSSPGKQKRWSYLLSVLGLDRQGCDTLRYQLFHRTASAVIEAQRFSATDAVMMVHSFSDKDTGFDDYKAFAELFDVQAGIGELLFIGERNNTRLHIGWARGDREFLD